MQCALSNKSCGMLSGMFRISLITVPEFCKRSSCLVLSLSSRSAAETAVDISGRPFLAWDVSFDRPKIGEMDTELFEEFFRALAFNAMITLHINRRAGHNAHHVAEACFKATARALRAACEIDPRASGAIPSTKGAL